MRSGGIYSTVQYTPAQYRTVYVYITVPTKYTIIVARPARADHVFHLTYIQPENISIPHRVFS